MASVRFEFHPQFTVDDSGFGRGNAMDISKVLDSVITEFYENLDNSKVTTVPVRVLSSGTKSPPTSNPEFIKLLTLNLIYLNTIDTYWSQYSYQFAHELCHHIVDTDFPPPNDRFGWFEEALCEMASIFVLIKMSEKWKQVPPYPHWSSYSLSLKNYADRILEDPQNNITDPFPVWLIDSFATLARDRYRRIENRIIAINVLPVFKHAPQLWQTIQYLKMIKVTNEMSIPDYVEKWEGLIPRRLRHDFVSVRRILFGYNKFKYYWELTVCMFANILSSK